MQLLDGRIAEPTGAGERFFWARAPRSSGRPFPELRPERPLLQRQRLAGLVIDVARLCVIGAFGRRTVVPDRRLEPGAEVVADHPVVDALGAVLAVQRVGAA